MFPTMRRNERQPAALSLVCLCASALVLAGCAGVESRKLAIDSRAAPTEVPTHEESGGDAEPVNPAEQRVQTMPPTRPEARSLGGVPWVSLGPSPTQGAQVSVPPDNEVTGAIHSIAPHPTNADILYIGAVNGGVWKTSNATAARPTWTPLTDTLPSQSIGAVAFDPLDPTLQTIVAGTGRWSNFAQRGDDEIGMYRSTNGGGSWTVLNSPALLGQKLIAVAARGPVLFAASSTGGLFRSVNTGVLFELASGLGNLPTGGIFDLVGNRNNNLQFYIAVRGAAPSVLRSDDGGVSWVDVTAGLAGLSASTSGLRLSIGAGGTVYAAIINGGALAGVARSANQGGTWTPMDVPAVHPGGQGSVNTALAADPVNPNLVYISGDRITASPFTGNVVRGDASLAAGSQFGIIHGSGGGNTSPHADSRAMAFDANNNLLEADDGGIYRRTAPSAAGTWGSVIGNLTLMEVHDLDHDRVANVVMIGTQDNGTHQQRAANDPRWTHINGGDGGDASIDDMTLGLGGSYRYISSQNLGGFRRAEYSAANVFVANRSLFSIADPQFVTPIELSAVDSSRMLIGGVNSIYESTNVTTATPTLTTTFLTSGANRNAMAYGAIGNPGAAYVGKNAAVLRREGSAFVATTALPAGAATITDVAMDPDDAQHVFAIDDNQVFRSTNGGGTWQDVTGNLDTISSRDYRTIEFIPDPLGDGVALGTRSGVYFVPVTSTTWSLLGSSLPDVLVFDMRFLPASRTLIAGTLGRGVWSLQLDPAFLFANSFE